MGRKHDRWMAAGSAALILAALLACKKKEEAPAPSASVAAPEPPPAASSAAPVAAADDVTRYGDKETQESGTVRVAISMVKVYQAADTASKMLTTLSKGTLVNLKARYGNWYLVNYPSGVAQLSPGWIMATTPTQKVDNVNPAEIASQQAAAAAAASASAAAAAAAASASAATAAASASAAAATASAAASTAAAAASTAAAAASAATPPKIDLPPRIKLPH